MTNDEPTAEESRGCIDLEITVCANGVVNVHRPESDRAHSVIVDESGGVLRCSCKGYHYRGHCSHADEIAERPIVTSSASAAAASTTPEIATDGGEPVDDESETCARCPKALDECHDEPAGHTVVTTDGEELCPECADARTGEEIGFVTDGGTPEASTEAIETIADLANGDTLIDTGDGTELFVTDTAAAEGRVEFAAYPDDPDAEAVVFSRSKAWVAECFEVDRLRHKDDSDESDDDRRTDGGEASRRGEVVGSESPDMGGGEESGVDEL